MYRADISEYSPKTAGTFHYVGRLDNVNYHSFALPNGTLDLDAVHAAVQNDQRMEIAWQACKNTLLPKADLLQ